MLQQDLTYLKNRTYGITLKVFKEEEEQERKRLDYKIKVNVIPTQPGRPYWYLSFTKSDIYYNRHEADLVSERLSTKISEAMYPIVVGVNHLNGVHEKMFKHDELIQKWEDKKTEIRKKYESDTVELLFKRMDSQFENPKRYWQNLKREYFWSLFFQPLLHLNLGQKIETVVELSLFPFRTHRVEGFLECSSAVTYYNTYLVTFKGAIVISSKEYEEAFKVKMDDNDVLVEVELEWDIDNVYNFIKHIEMNMVYKMNSDIEEKILRRVEWTCYMTDEEERERIEEKQPTTWVGKLIDKVLNL